MTNETLRNAIDAFESKELRPVVAVIESKRDSAIRNLIKGGQKDGELRGEIRAYEFILNVKEVFLAEIKDNAIKKH